MKKGIQFIIKVLFFTFIVYGFIFSESTITHAEDGKICEPYTITICNICGQNYDGCPHSEGVLYGTTCTPYLVCNICGQNYDGCPHSEGDTYGGTICSPDPDGRLCNICGLDYRTCPHAENDTYGGTECSFSYGRICNICGQNYDGCPHSEGDFYVSIICSPHPGYICNGCNGNFAICGHEIGGDDGYTVFEGRICNICNNNYNGCPHSEGSTYDTNCTPFNGKICNICGGNFETCSHQLGTTYGGTECQPYSATVCNICGANYHGCPHSEGQMYGAGVAVCTPYLTCNICEDSYVGCPHSEGTIYDGTTCDPFSKRICNICGGNFEICEHKAGDYYNINTLESAYSIDYNNIKIAPVNVEIQGNDIIIRVYASFWEYDEIMYPGGDKTYEQLAKEGFNKWAGTYDVFGRIVNVKIICIDSDENNILYPSQCFAGINIIDGSGRSYVDFRDGNWNISNSGTMIVYSGTGEGSYERTRTQTEFINTVAHEFGHMLGLDDAYGEGDRPEADVNAETPKDDLMRTNWGRTDITGNDIEMVVLAWYKKEMQYYKSYSEGFWIFKDDHKQSTAIGN